MKVLLILTFFCLVFNAYSKNSDLDFCSSTLESYREFSKLNSDTFRNDFESFAINYINTLKGCQNFQSHRFGIREILFDTRSDKQIKSEIINYFNASVPQSNSKARNIWRTEIYIMARQESLGFKIKLNLYEMAERHGENVIAMEFTNPGRSDISKELYNRVVEDYLFEKPLSKHHRLIYQNLIQNSSKRPLSKKEYLALMEVNNDYVKDRARLRYESNSEDEYRIKLRSLEEGKAEQYNVQEKFKKIVFLLPFLLLSIMSPLLAFHRHEANRVVIYKFLIWLPELIITISLLFMGIVPAEFYFWLWLPILSFVIYKVSRDILYEICLSVVIMLILGFIAYSIVMVLSSLP